MKINARMMSLLAATAAVATLALAAPAAAAEDTGSSVAAKATRPVSARFAMPRYFRPTPARLDCSGTWCGRHFVLMIGIGY
jgi:hypothetical protein